MAPLNRTIVGLDFGTTYTGVAIAWGQSVKDIEVITNWPGGAGVTREKVPSEFSYDVQAVADNPPRELTSGQVLAQPGATRDIRWGYQITNAEKRIRCIKLFLDRNQDLPSFINPLDLALELKASGRNAVDAVSDFLAKIHNHTLEVIKRRCGEALAKTMVLHFVLTVPAIWSDTAKDATKEAALRAGIPEKNITMISEPEAGAICALYNQQKSLKIGDIIVVCDAGGGIVDLISYKITKLSPLAVEEVSVGTGGLCGAAFLNYAFEDHLRALLGDKTYAEWRIEFPVAFEKASEHFEEYVKRNFSDSEVIDSCFAFPGVPNHKAANIHKGLLVLKHGQVKKIFASTVEQILTLIQDQVATVQAGNGSVSSIILVGGFGQSQYLYECVKSHFDPSKTTTMQSKALATRRKPVVFADKHIEIIQPANAWSAVVRGAVISGIQGSLATKRMSRFHYGTTIHPEWDGKMHPITSRYLDPFNGSFRAEDAMKWFVNKGQAISNKQTISLCFSESFDKHRVSDRETLTTYNVLYACSGSEAPLMYSDSFQEVCGVEANLSAVPLRNFTKMRTPDGQRYYHLEYKLDLKINSADLSFELRVNGRGYGEAKAKFNH